MQIWESIVLGIVQGLSEFLPISSSAHLVLAQTLLGVATDDLVFDLIVHLATLAAVFTLFHKLIWNITKDTLAWLITRKTTQYSQTGWMIVIASLPTAAIGLLFKENFEQSFSNLTRVGVSMIITGIFLYITKRITRNEPVDQGPTNYHLAVNDIDKMSWMQSFAIGVAQGISIDPGISRSGATIVTALFAKVPRKLASVFSFLISVPAILGAFVLQAKDADWTAMNYPVVIAGFIAAYFTGLIGLAAVVKVVRQGRLDIFSVYLWVVGGITVYYSLR